MGKYFCAQLKRLLRVFLPVLLVTAILFGCLMVVFDTVSSMTEESKVTTKFQIGVVGTASDFYLQMGLKAMESIDSTRFSIELVEMEEKAAEDAMRKGTIAAFMVFPEGFLDAAFHGEIMPLIREFDCGRIEGEKYADVLDQYGDAFREILEVDDFRSFGGENYEDVRERVRAFMAFAESLNCEKIAAFSHAGYILTFFDEVMHRDGKPGRNIRCDNGSVNVFECIEGEWKVSAFNVTETL